MNFDNTQSSRRKPTRHQSMISYLLKRIDAFKIDLPTFQLNGKQQVASIYGGILTILMLGLMLWYAGLKLEMLITRANPTVSTFKEEFVLTSEDRLNLKDAGMYFAWTWEGYNDKKLKDDPRYVKQLVRLSGRRQGKLKETILNYHKCTWEELEQFPDPTLDSGRVLNSIMKDEERALFCLDREALGDILEIWGVSQYDDFQYLDFALLPCQYNHTFTGLNNDTIHPECVWDRQEQMDYLGNIRCYVYMTEQVFILNEYGDRTIKRRSRFYQQQLENTAPTYLPGMM